MKVTVNENGKLRVEAPENETSSIPWTVISDAMYSVCSPVVSLSSLGSEAEKKAHVKMAKARNAAHWRARESTVK